MRKSVRLKGVAAMSKKESNNQSCTLPKRVLFFATGNIHKFNEAREILSHYHISVGMLRVKGDEIQSESLEEIAETAVANAFKQTGLPIFVEDAGLFIKALKGFPGPYAAYTYKTIHNSGIIKLMENIDDRTAKFQSVIAYYDHAMRQPLCFYGESRGIITKVERWQQGKSGFGFDPIFQPSGSSKTFAEMTIEEKNDYSHRAMAIKKLAEWYRKK